MLSKELKYSTRLSEEGTQTLSTIWHLFQSIFPYAFDTPGNSIELGINTIYKVIGTSDWNEKDKEGQRVGIMATNLDNTLAFVIFLDDPQMRGNVYKVEHLEVTEVTYEQLIEEKNTQNEKV